MYIRLLLALLTAIALAACVGPTQSQGLLIEAQTVDGLAISLEAIESPRLNRPFELVAALADEQGRPVDGALVSFDLTMPAMPMGTNAPIAEPLGQGRYRAGNVVMDMTGDWEIAVLVELDGVERRAVFTRVAVE